MESVWRSQCGGVSVMESVWRSQCDGVSVKESVSRSQCEGISLMESVWRSQCNGVSVMESVWRSQCGGVSVMESSEEKIPPLAGSCPYSGSPTLDEPPLSSLKAELADMSSDGGLVQRAAGYTALKGAYTHPQHRPGMMLGA
ncbi:unnamed protein product [Pleuronectes platessa]|uniref:Uncharacterized protein n=1 Tax=Pleuronectes platessa TaxID=8262 RepID=A0A9N7U0L0_PLEPL|nr:unnamed protein product [Pleuronectes platessa]